MTAFKVGDKVRLHSDAYKDLSGREATVSTVDESALYPIDIDFPEEGWDPSMYEGFPATGWPVTEDELELI